MLEPLTQPRDGKYFTIWKLLIHVNWAKTNCWAMDNDMVRHRFLFGIHTEQLVDGDGTTALQMLCGKLKVTIGII